MRLFRRGMHWGVGFFFYEDQDAFLSEQNKPKKEVKANGSMVMEGEKNHHVHKTQIHNLILQVAASSYHTQIVAFG